MILFWTNCLCHEQICDFARTSWQSSSIKHYSAKYYSCIINHAKLTSEEEIVTTNIERNLEPSEEVTSLEYKFNNELKFIPNSIFETFPRIQFLFIVNAKLDNLKPSYLKKAEHLKLLRISHNAIIELNDNLFLEAPNLENINLEQNKIEIIHRFTFSGLPKVYAIYLASNRIKNLPFNSFDGLPSLQVLNLQFNNCINFKFGHHFKEIIDPKEIEEQIWKDCSQDFYYTDSIVEDESTSLNPITGNSELL